MHVLCVEYYVAYAVSEFCGMQEHNYMWLDHICCPEKASQSALTAGTVILLAATDMAVEVWMSV